MSHSFYVDNLDNVNFSDVIKNLPNDAVKLTEDSPQPVNGQWPEGESYLYIDNVSLRPVETSFSEGTFRARVFAHSSDEDYRLAIQLVTEIASKNHQKVTPEDNDPLEIETLLKEYNDDWIREHRNDMFRMLVDSHKRSGTVSMWGTNRQIKAGERFFGQVLAYGESALNEYAERFKLLNYMDAEDIYIAQGIRLAEKDGKDVLFSLLTPEVSTILHDGINAVALNNNDDAVYIELDAFADVLGEKCKWLSEHTLFVPAISKRKWAILMDDLSDLTFEDPYQLGSPVEAKSEDCDRLKSRFSDAEWHLLLCSPILVFLSVAGADGEVDDKEIKSFQKELTLNLVSDSALLQEVMMALLPELPSYTKLVMSGEIDPVTGFSQIKKSLDEKVDAETALSFKMALLKMGKSIAESSGGFLGIFGSKISKEEKQALAALSALLGLIDLD